MMRSPLIAVCVSLFASAASTHAGDECDAVWSALGEGVNGDVREVAVVTLDGEERVFAGGWFGSGLNFAEWDGNSWVPLGGGFNSIVHAIAVFDDGRGPALFVAGDFTQVGD